MKYIKLFEEFNSVNDTRIVNGVKANDVVDYFDRNDFYGVDAQFLDFDSVELTVSNSEDMTQDEIDEKLDGAESVIFSVHLQSDNEPTEPDFDDFEEDVIIPKEEEIEPFENDELDPAGGHGLHSHE